jgi:HPt (histidine-containing phosphotransfer) domain-containing protein
MVERYAPRLATPAPAGPVGLARLMEAAGGDKGVAAELASLFLETTEELVRRMSAALAAGDLQALRAAAHTLKGASANVGADALSAAAARVESLAAAPGSHPSECAAAVEAALQEADAASRFLQQMKEEAF